MNTEWLKEICNPSSEGIIKEPKHCVVDGITYEYSTDSWVLYALAVSDSELSFLHNDTVDKMLRHNGHGKTTTLESLRDWAGADNRALCPSCNGAGYICDEDEDDCDVCLGFGWTGYKLRLGIIDGVVINRWLVAKAFVNLYGKYVNVISTGVTDPVYFISDNWRVAVIPMGWSNVNLKKADAFCQWSGQS